MRPFDADPIKFLLRADKHTAAIGEEITITVTAHYLNIPSALLFTTAGSNAFRLKVLMPDGFVQTGGDNLEYIGTELSATKPTVTYTLKGYFVNADNGNEFRLLRSHANADVNSLFVEKARLSIRVTPAESSVQQKHKGARAAAVSNGVGFIDEADCNTVRGWAADQGQPNVAVNVDFFIDGQFAGSTQASQYLQGVAAYLGDNGNHGFAFTMPQQFRSSGNHSVEARFSGTSQGLNSGPKAYACSGGSTTSNPSTNPNPSSGGCSFSEGQYLFAFHGEQIYAHYHNGILFAAYQNASEGYKPRHWMQAAGFDQSKVPCFAATDPRNGTTTTPTNNPNPTGGCGNGSGLTGFYSNSSDLSQNLVAIRTDARIDFSWNNDSPIPNVVNADFSVRWIGQVEAPVSGNYTFKTNNDDGTRVWVNGQLLIDDWNGHGPTWRQGSISLNAGQKYDIEIGFVDFGGGAQAQLYWEYPGQGLQIVPSCRLYTQIPKTQYSDQSSICSIDVNKVTYFCKCNEGTLVDFVVYSDPIPEYDNEPYDPIFHPGSKYPTLPAGVGGGSIPGPWGPGGNPGLPKFRLTALSAEAASRNKFYANMQARGITFTNEEKAVLNEYPTFRAKVSAYVNQYGSKPDGSNAFKMSLADQQKYPKFANFLRNNIRDYVMSRPKILNALKTFSGLSEQKIRALLPLGYGPTIVVEQLAHPDVWGEGGYVYGQFDADFDPNIIKIDQLTLIRYEQAGLLWPELESALFTLLAQTLIHEMSHYGANLTQTIDYTDGQASTPQGGLYTHRFDFAAFGYPNTGGEVMRRKYILKRAP